MGRHLFVVLTDPATTAGARFGFTDVPVEV